MSKAALNHNKTPHNIFSINPSQPVSHLCKCCACWVSFPIRVLKVCCQFVYCEIALYLVKYNFSRSLLRVGNRLIGWLFEPVKGALLILGRGMTYASLQAWGHTLSSRLKLKIWQIGVSISSILSNVVFSTGRWKPEGRQMLHRAEGEWKIVNPSRLNLLEGENSN